MVTRWTIMLLKRSARRFVETNWTVKQLKIKAWVMLVSQVPVLEILLKLSHLLSFYTVWAASLLTSKHTGTTHDLNRLLEGSIPASDSGQNDKFGTCTKILQNVFYMCNMHYLSRTRLFHTCNVSKLDKPKTRLIVLQIKLKKDARAQRIKANTTNLFFVKLVDVDVRNCK